MKAHVSISSNSIDVTGLKIGFEREGFRRQSLASKIAAEDLHELRDCLQRFTYLSFTTLPFGCGFVDEYINNESFPPITFALPPRGYKYHY
jgi:hypothetical protein